MAITYMTEEGYKKLMEEIAYLENVKRPEISRAIGEARDKGDLSENAEYDAAKEAQGMLEMKISQLKDVFRKAHNILRRSACSTCTKELLKTSDLTLSEDPHLLCGLLNPSRRCSTGSRFAIQTFR